MAGNQEIQIVKKGKEKVVMFGDDILGSYSRMDEGCYIAQVNGREMISNQESVVFRFILVATESYNGANLGTDYHLLSRLFLSS